MASLNRLLATCNDAPTLKAFHMLHLDAQRRRKKDWQPPQLTHLPLESLLRRHSISEYLSPKPLEGYIDPMIITLNGKPLDATYLVLLALNEECRKLKRGCFYYLPFRQEDNKAHPTDLVFIDEGWNDHDITEWDRVHWDKRLKMCCAEGTIHPHEEVVAVCTRILKFDLPQATRVFSTNQVYASSSDPAVRFHSNVSAWSRPLADHSRVLILYMHHHCMPVISHINAAEDPSQANIFPTPNDVSITVVPNWLVAESTVFGRTSNRAAPRASVRKNLAVKLGNREVVLAMLYIWNKGSLPILHDTGDFSVLDGWQNEFGGSKVLWQEIQNRLESYSTDAQKEMLEYWLKE